MRVSLQFAGDTKGGGLLAALAASGVLAADLTPGDGVTLTNEATYRYLTLDMGGGSVSMQVSSAGAAALVLTNLAGDVININPRFGMILPKVVAPGAPAANTGVVFLQDAAGKMQLAARFPSGAVQVIATEP